MQINKTKALIGGCAFLACFFLFIVIGILAYLRTITENSPEYKATSSAQKIEPYDCPKCSGMWKVTLYAADGWVDTGIQLQKGQSVHVSPAPLNISGFYEKVIMRLNGKEQNCIGRSPVRSNQTLSLRYNGAGDVGSFRDYIVAEVRVSHW